jgi:hypothetical protein
LKSQHTVYPVFYSLAMKHYLRPREGKREEERIEESERMEEGIERRSERGEGIEGEREIHCDTQTQI